MTDMKAVAPGAIETYAATLNAGVDKITDGLNELCASITNVNYGGKNAFKFKTDTGTLANNLSTTLYDALTQLKTDVSAATSNLSEAFGASGIPITLKDNTITPADPGEDTVDGVASVSGLRTLSTQVESAFTTIKSGIGMVADMPANTPAGWMGDKRNTTEGHVNEFVGLASSKSDTTKTSITDFITSQITAIENE